MPQDRCALDPVTKARLGPSVLSTMVIIISFMLLLLGTTTTAYLVVLDEEATSQFIIFGSGIHWTCMLTYFIYYKKCHPWTGWFIFMVGAIVGQTIVAIGSMSRFTDQWKEMCPHF